MINQENTHKTAYEFDMMPADKFVEEISKLPKREEVIKGILPKGQVMLIAGDPWSGKSLEFQRLSCEFGKGGSYHGLKCNKCRAAYFTWEGAGDSIAERFNRLLDVIKPELAPLVKMFPEPIPLNTRIGYNMMYSVLEKCKQDFPDLEVVMYDSFPYLIDGKIKEDDTLSTWWSQMTKLHHAFDLTPIFVYEERKLIMGSKQSEDPFGLQRLKGSYQIAYKANTVIMIGEEKGAERSGENVNWVSKGHRIAVAKVKDGRGRFERLEVDLNRDTLQFEGQRWVFNNDIKEYEATEEMRR